MPVCEQCGIEHALDELELSFKRPDATAELSPEERNSTVQENTDLSVLSGERFFVRAVMPIPVLGWSRPYNFGIWVEVNRLSFERIYLLWDSAGQAEEPPFSAVVANEIPLLPQTIGLAAQLNLSGPTARPSVRLAAAAHPLVAEQSRGISVHRAHEYSSVFA